MAASASATAVAAGLEYYGKGAEQRGSPFVERALRGVPALLVGDPVVEVGVLAAVERAEPQHAHRFGDLVALAGCERQVRQAAASAALKMAG